MKVTAFDAVYSQQVTMGGTLLVSSDGSNSGTSGGDILGESGDLSVVRLRSTVALSSNLTGSVGDVLTIIQNSPLTAQFATPSNSGGAAFGSNTTRISEVASVGFSSNTSRSDHIHDGIGQVTASSSNTLQRGTLNLRPGTGMALALSDADGSGVFDTITLVNTVAAGGGSGGSGAPTTTKYITAAADAGLSAEIVIPGMEGSADIVPASPSADDDEFSALSGWTTLGSLTTSSASDRASHWHVIKATAGLQIHGIYKAGPAVPYAAVIKISDYSIHRGNYTEYGMGVGDSTPTAWCTFMFSSYQTSVQRDTWTNNTSRASSANGTTGALYSLPKYLFMSVNSATSMNCWWSDDGKVWSSAFSAVNPGFTPVKFGLTVSANGVEAEAFYDYVRFYTGTAGQTFNPSTRAWA